MFPTLVWTVIVVVPGELVQDGRGVVFVVDVHSVGAFGSDAAGGSFGMTVGLGSSWWDLRGISKFVIFV
jgi:hypothetical protein